MKVLGVSCLALTFSKPLMLFAKYNRKMDSKAFEVIIIGGSYAGFSTAMTLGRSLRSTLIIDAGKPCNRQTPHTHNFLTQDGSTPAEISEIAKSQVLKYDTVKYYEGLAVGAKKLEKGFEITSATGEVFTAKKIVFATGIKDLLLDVEGFSDCWGISVVHCPYCHGYEIRDKKTAIMANGDKAFHLVSLVNNLSQNLTILTSGKHTFDQDQLAKLKQHNIPIIEMNIEAITHKNGQLEQIVFADGSAEHFDCAYAVVPFEQSTLLPKQLGCNYTDEGYIQVDFMQKTSEEGIFACGDNSTMMRAVSTAIYGGNIAGAIINNELVHENF